MKKEFHPSKLATKFLKWFCSEELIEEIQGDLLEAYYYRCENYGKLKADIWYITDVVKFFKPYSFEKHSNTKQFMPMFNSYCKVSLRNIAKRGLLSSLNILGLSVGITSVVLLSLYIHHEMTFDQSFPDSENIYRVINKDRDQIYTCIELPNGRQSDFEESTRLTTFLRENDNVEDACHFVPDWSAMGPAPKTYLYIDGKEFVRDDFLYTNTGLSFQHIFPQTFLMGNPESAFTTFNKLILTESVAEVFYGTNWASQDLLNKKIKMNNDQFQIGGVIEDMPGNVHFDFGLIVHQKTIPSWAAYTYFKIKPGIDESDVLRQLNASVELIFPDYYDDGLEKRMDLVPLNDIHFTNGTLYEMKPVANAQYLFTFAIVGFVILLIIWTNYSNLSIATYAKRQKELGIRRVIGARACDITMQIIIEAIMLAIFCFPIVWILSYLFLPTLNALLGISIAKTVLYSVINLLILLVALVFTGLISSLYPAFSYGSKSLVRLVSGKLSTKIRNVFQFRRVLLTGQFFMLIGLMSLALIIMRQMEFIQKKELGYEKEGVIFFDVEGQEKYNQLKEIVKSYPEVSSVGNGMVPGANMYNQITYKLMGTDQVMDDGIHIYTSMSGLELIGIKSEAFDLIREGQDSVFIINQTAAEKMAKMQGIMPDELIGSVLVMDPEWENEYWGNGIHYSIAAIINDFDYFSLKHESQSLLIEVHEKPDWVYNMIIKVNAGDWVEIMTKIEEAYLTVEKEIPFSFTFLDEKIDQLYEKERNAGRLASLLTIICILLSISGLVGVVGFITQLRQKEIGVRKVFGATVRDILSTISKEYVVMIIVATVTAIPAALYLSDLWLASFAYRISPSFLEVVYSGFITLMIVIAVVVIQSYKSANMNPSDTLRYE